MRKLFFVLALIIPLVSENESAAESNFSFGLGLGAPYAGFGINLALESEYNLRYIALGCVAVSHSEIGGTAAACGIGLGWINAHILTQSNERHGLGIYLGPVGFKEINSFKNGSPHQILRSIYGVGLTYAYYFKGIGNGGWNLGLTPALGPREGEIKGFLLGQVGYQF